MELAAKPLIAQLEEAVARLEDVDDPPWEEDVALVVTAARELLRIARVSAELMAVPIEVPNDVLDRRDKAGEPSIPTLLTRLVEPLSRLGALKPLADEVPGEAYPSADFAAGVVPGQEIAFPDLPEFTRKSDA